jgi:hypothetical protein
LIAKHKTESNPSTFPIWRSFEDIQVASLSLDLAIMLELLLHLQKFLLGKLFVRVLWIVMQFADNGVCFIYAPLLKKPSGRKW